MLLFSSSEADCDADIAISSVKKKKKKETSMVKIQPKDKSLAEKLGKERNFGNI